MVRMSSKEDIHSLGQQIVPTHSSSILPSLEGFDYVQELFDHVRCVPFVALSLG